MRTGSFLAALLAVLPAFALADIAVPDTPAGHVFGAWLVAFNSDDPARLEAFTRKYQPGKNPDDGRRWKADTDIYDLLEVHSSDRLNVFFRVKARTNGAEEVGRLSVSATEPLTVTELGTWRIPAGAKMDVVVLDQKSRAKLVEGVASLFETIYVTPEPGKKMAAALRKHEARGEYREILYGQDLARRLTGDLREVGHDKHAEVRFSFFARPVGAPARNPGEVARRLAAINCGFEKAEHLRPNIGYLKFNGFAEPEACAQTAGAAMTFLADSDALIIDLRDNNGGLGAMVEFIASYLFEERTRLDDLFNRAENSTRESWTLPFVPGKKFIDKPIFVLTSNRTFSAAEYLGYVLRDRKHATLIGETTGGGGHTVEPRPLDDHFVAVVPTGRPMTKIDWEGVGLEPDVKVPAAEALEVALKLAADNLAASGHDR